MRAKVGVDEWSENKEEQKILDFVPRNSKCSQALFLFR